jgi:hypothetical protein
MPPGFGQQPRFIVTIQPPGVHFDPPAAMSLPNVDGLAPGEVTELYSFDHDLGQFVAIGTGSVSKEGAVITSDPGVGIIKGGWHCGGNPAASGTSANCGDCAKCTGVQCVADPARQSQPCSDDGDNCTADFCDAGKCQHYPVNVDLSLEHPGTGALSGSEEDFPGGLVAIQRTQDSPMTRLILHKVSRAVIGGQFRLTTLVSTVRVWRNGDRTGQVLNGELFDATVDTTLYLDATGPSLYEADQTLTINWVKDGRECPRGDSVSVTAVEAEYEITLNDFIPAQWISIPHPLYLTVVAKGDDRSYDSASTSYRVGQRVTLIPFKAFDVHGVKPSTKTEVVGESATFDKKTSLPDPAGDYGPSNRLLPVALAEPHDDAHKGAPYMTNFGYADMSEMFIDEQSRTSDKVITVNLHGAAADPLIFLAADIDWTMMVTIDASDKIHPHA